MIAILFARLLAFLGLLAMAATAGCAAPQVRADSALPAGPAMVVIAPLAPSAADLESEAYADWAAYLEDYLATKPATLKVARLDRAKWQALARRPPPRDPYTTIFLRRDGSSLVHEGKILEVAVYQAGAAWATGSSPARLMDMGYSPGQPIRRR